MHPIIQANIVIFSSELPGKLVYIWWGNKNLITRIRK